MQIVRVLPGLRVPLHPPVAPEDDLAVAGLRCQGRLGQGDQEEERHEGRTILLFLPLEISTLLLPVKVSLTKMNELMRRCFQTWPLYYFLTVFPLLSSRICHPQEEVWHLLRSVFSTVHIGYMAIGYQVKWVSRPIFAGPIC